MEISPIDAQVVARPIQNILVTRAHIQHRQPSRAGSPPHYLLIGAVDRDARVCIQVDIHVVTNAVRRMDIPRYIRYRPGQYVDIVGKRRSEERQLQIDTARFELITSVGRRDFLRALAENWSPLRPSPQEAVTLSVNPYQACQWLLRASPVLYVFVCQMVGHQPDAEVRIVRDQG